MGQVRYTIGGGPSAEQLDRMHAAALRVIRELGVDVGLPAILERVADILRQALARL